MAACVSYLIRGSSIAAAKHLFDIRRGLLETF